MKTVLSRGGFNKRSGTSMNDVLFSLMLWLWLQKEFVGMFARDCLQGAMAKDVLYDTMNRELDVKALFQHYIRKAWQPIRGQKYQAKMADVELNLAERKGHEEGSRSICYSR